jgi:hypothetical protein
MVLSNSQIVEQWRESMVHILHRDPMVKKGASTFSETLLFLIPEVEISPHGLSHSTIDVRRLEIERPTFRRFVVISTVFILFSLDPLDFWRSTILIVPSFSILRSNILNSQIIQTPGVPDMSPSHVGQAGMNQKLTCGRGSRGDTCPH